MHNVAEFFSSYCVGGTYSILLEFADVGTLEDYMHNVDEPKSGREILDFWSSLLEILTPLMTIHGLQTHDSYETRFMLG